MENQDEQNLQLAQSTESVDSINTDFYSRFQYPWVPMAFDTTIDRSLETVMLNQSIGDWDQTVLKPKSRIWVAGCGTNQAVFTALRFPDAEVIGSDLSEKSLSAASANAKMLDITNLTLKQESLNDQKYGDEFDYVICTGVIHHVAEPSETLKSLVHALRPDGIIELMVYNRYHRIMPTAFQKAVRAWTGTSSSPDFDKELGLAKGMVNGFCSNNEMKKFLEHYKTCTEPEFADVLLQPVEHFFTIESLDALTQGAKLSLLSPCINQFDKLNNTYTWNVTFQDKSLQESYDTLPNKKRWLIANHLLLERSPMLWFYLNRTDSSFKPKSERQQCDEFLSKQFTVTKTKRKLYTKTDNGEYRLLPRQLAYPSPHPDPTYGNIINQIENNPSNTLNEILDELEFDKSFSSVNRLRLMLTTNAFPYLRAK